MHSLFFNDKILSVYVYCYSYVKIFFFSVNLSEIDFHNKCFKNWLPNQKAFTQCLFWIACLEIIAAKLLF